MKNKYKYQTYIQIRISGLEVERFINLCRHGEIELWDMHQSEESDCEDMDNAVHVKISRKDFFRLKPYIRKCRVQVRIIKKRYMRYYIFRYRKHYSFAAGLGLAFGILKLFSFFLWDISFTGNYVYTDNLLAKHIEGIGIRAGMPLSDLDCDYIETSLRDRYNITWACAEIKGNRLIVHIKENYHNVEIKDEDETVRGMDITAVQGGIVESIITRNGTPKVTKGDTVNAGDVLVEGIIRVYDDAGTEVSFYPVVSDADILIKTTFSYEESLAKQYTKKEFTGRTLKKVFGGTRQEYVKISLGLKKFEHFDTVRQNENISIFNTVKTPIFYGSEILYEYREVEAEYTEDEAKQILEERFLRYLDDLREIGVQIMDVRVNIETDTNGYKYIGSIDVLTPEVNILPSTMPDGSSYE